MLGPGQMSGPLFLPEHALDWLQPDAILLKLHVPPVLSPQLTAKKPDW